MAPPHGMGPIKEHLQLSEKRRASTGLVCQLFNAINLVFHVYAFPKLHIKQFTLKPKAQSRVTARTAHRVFAILSRATAGHRRTALNCARCWCSCHGDERSTMTNRSSSRSRQRVTFCTPQTISRLINTSIRHTFIILRWHPCLAKIKLTFTQNKKYSHINHFSLPLQQL